MECARNGDEVSVTFIVFVTLPDGSMHGFGPFGFQRAAEIERQLEDLSVYHRGDIDGPEFSVDTIPITKWPGIRQYTKELEENQ